jgi:hypothetical protein
MNTRSFEIAATAMALFLDACKPQESDTRSPPPIIVSLKPYPPRQRPPIQVTGPIATNEVEEIVQYLVRTPASDFDRNFLHESNLRAAFAAGIQLTSLGDGRAAAAFTDTNINWHYTCYLHRYQTTEWVQAAFESGTGPSGQPGQPVWPMPDDPVAPNPNITKANAAKIEPGTTLAQVEAILGFWRAIDNQEAPTTARDSRLTWKKWTNHETGSFIIVGFAFFRLIQRMLMASMMAWVLVGGCLLISGPTARAQERARWGTSASSSLYQTCWPYFCNFSGSVFGDSIDQALGTNVHSTASAPFGSASVDATLVSTNHLNFPRFTGAAITADTGLYWCQATATISEGYHYIGETNKTFLFTYAVAAFTTATNSWDGLTVELHFCRETNFQFTTDMGWLLYESGVEIITNRVVTVLSTNSSVPQSDVVECPVGPGERFYLVARCFISIFQRNGLSQMLTPAEVTCLNPEGLISESDESDIPVRAAVHPDGVRLSWRATRRQCELQRAASALSGSWTIVTNAIVSSPSGNQLSLAPEGDAGFFRLWIH